MGIFIFLFGCIIGSFLNVCIYRIPRGESIVYPPSHCTKCGKEIGWYDLFPVVSYIFLKGKCRYCGDKIPCIYPLNEILTGILFFSVYITYGTSFTAIKYIIFISFIMVIAIIDLKTKDVYSITTYLGIGIGIAILIIDKFLYGNAIGNYLLAGLIGGGLIAIIVFTIGGMGEGDIEICALCGVFLGIKYTLLMLFLTFFIGALISVFLIVIKRKTRKDYIPLGPFIGLASIITILFGEKILNMYFILFI